MTRTRSEWKIRDHVFTIGERTLIMGVVNVTPDSFSDGGKYLDPDEAAARALELEDQGADIIDIGAESTKPGSERINAGEELRRLVPVLKRLKNRLNIPISVDTYKAEVAEKALEHGAAIINDVSALTWEPDLVKHVVKCDAGLILNHMRGTPQTWARLAPLKNIMESVTSELEAAAHRAVQGGVSRDRIVIDPGIGFGKRGAQNFEILARLGELRRLLFPILAAVSRKGFLAQENPDALEFATAAAVTTAILNGASIVRVHDVESMRAVVQVTDATIEALPEPEVKPDRSSARPIRIQDDRPKPVRPPEIAKPAVTEPQEEPPRRPFERRPVEEVPPPPERPVYDRAPREDRKPFEKRAKPFDRRDDRRPFQRRDDDSREGRPPRKFAGPPSGDRPPRKFAGPPSGDRPPRKFAGPPSGDRPPRKFAGPPSGDRPPRKFAGPPSGDRPPRKFAGPPSGDRPPRKFAGPPSGDRPPRKFAGPPSGDRPPRKFSGRPSGDRPPRKFAGPPSGDRPPRKFSGPSSGERRPPRKFSGPPSGDRRGPSKFSGGPRKNSGGSGPRKRPGGRPRDDR